MAAFWSKQEEDIVRTHYGKIQYSELMVMLPLRGKHNIRKKAEQLGLTQRRQKYTYDKDYFSNLSVESAYWAGFIAADGHNRCS